MDDHKSEHVIKEVSVGVLYDPPDSFFEMFFEEVNVISAIEKYRKQKKGLDYPKAFMIPSQLLPVGDNHILYWEKYDVKNETVPGFEKLNWDLERIASKERPVYAIAKYQLGCLEKTLPGPIFVISEIRTGSRVKFYKVWINGQERYLTENQLKYVKEVK